MLADIQCDREYNRVPSHLKVDTLIPSVSEIPSFFSSLRHPRKARAVSVGPQSEADAYETLALREKRRESVTRARAASPIKGRQTDADGPSSGYFGSRKSASQSNGVLISGMLPTPVASKLDLYSEQMGSAPAVFTPLESDDESTMRGPLSRTVSQDQRQNDKEDREMFSQLEKPRVRYDVEVVTKLIVYAGMSTIQYFLC